MNSFVTKKNRFFERLNLTGIMNRRHLLQWSALTAGGFLASPFTGETRTPQLPSDWLKISESEKPFLRLGSNENHNGPSKKSLKYMEETLKLGNLYGDERARQLIAAIAAKQGVAPENILLGAGSTEILGLTALLALQQGGEMLTADPTFKIWMPMAKALGASVKTVQLTPEKYYDLPRLSAQMGSNTRLIYICNPNNPTGTKLERARLSDFIQAHLNTTKILLDEVYLEFVEDTSFAQTALQHPNLIIARSFSKVYGLAGMRIGYAIAHADAIAALARLQPRGNNGISQPAAAAALGALEDTRFVQQYLTDNREALRITADFLSKIDVKYIPSVANLMYFSLEKYQPDFLPEMLKKGVMMREVVEADGSRWGRVSMGTPKMMQAFCERLGEMPKV
jgi:histidinol-phosphate aminotransferase